MESSSNTVTAFYCFSCVPSNNPFWKILSTRPAALLWLLLFYFQNFIYLFIYLFLSFFLAALGLRCCAWAFSSCGERGLLFVAVRGSSQCGGFSYCGARALGTRASVVAAPGSSAQAQRLWDLPGPGLEPMSPALAGRLLTTAPPGKSLVTIINSVYCTCTIANKPNS